MGNKQSKSKQDSNKKSNKKKGKFSSKFRFRSSTNNNNYNDKSITDNQQSNAANTQPSTQSKQRYTYSECLKQIEDELNKFVPFDLTMLILSYFPRSTIGDELNPISPYDVLNIHVQIISPYARIPLRVLSIFNCVSPNCHCGSVLNYNIYHQNDYNYKQFNCDQCSKPIQNHLAYYECPLTDNIKHKNDYKICQKCINLKVKIYQVDDGNLLNSKTLINEPKQDHTLSFNYNRLITTKTQRRVCLAFTEDYVRVWLHCFDSPLRRSFNEYCKALYTTENEWRSNRDTLNMDERQIGILMDDFSGNNFDNRGKRWCEYMEKCSGGADDGIYCALCHCNQVNNKIGMNQKNDIQNYLYKKKTVQHTNIHDNDDLGGVWNTDRKPWRNLSKQLFQCSITENEDTITAILDVVGGYLSNLSDEQKLKLTYRGKWNKNKNKTK